MLTPRTVNIGGLFTVSYGGAGVSAEQLLKVVFHLQMQRHTQQPGAPMLIADVYVCPGPGDVYRFAKRTNLAQIRHNHSETFKSTIMFP